LPFVLGAKTHDIATGSFVALGSVGAIIRKKDDTLSVVKLADSPAPTRLDSNDATNYARTSTSVIDHDGTSFVYWVASSKLLRRSVDPSGTIGNVETLALDAEDGVSVSGVRVADESGAPRDVVAYVAGRADKKGRILHVWIEGEGPRGVGTEPLGASAVWAVSEAPATVSVLRVDQRAALAPISVIKGTLAAGGEPRWGEDTVVWMAPASDLLSTVSAVKSGESLVSLMATYQSGMSFGLAAAPVVVGARPVDDATWFEYPNGLDPPLVRPMQVCGRGVAVAVIPTDKPIAAPRAIELLSIDPNGAVQSRLEIGRAGRIDHIATWSAPGGDGWIAWVGDGRTLVRSVRCSGPALPLKPKRP
jgi:hypothetical protein